MNSVVFVCLLFFLYSCESLDIENNDVKETYYSVRLDTVFQLGQTTSTTVEIYSNRSNNVTFTLNDTTKKLFDDGSFHINGDFLKGDNVYSGKVDLSSYINQIVSLPYKVLIDDNTIFNGNFHVIDTISFSSIFVNSTVPTSINISTDSQQISLQIDEEKFSSNNITRVSYTKLNSSNEEIWAKELSPINPTNYSGKISNIDMNYATLDSTNRSFAFKFESAVKSEFVNTHTILLRNRKPEFVQDSIYATKTVNSRTILPVEITVSNFEGIDEVERVYILSVSQNQIPFHNDGINGGDRVAEDSIWRVELDISTATSGTHVFKGFIVDKGGNVSNEFSIEFDL